MAENVEIVVKKTGRSFSGRLVGIIDEEECQAVVNTPSAGRRIFSVSSLSFCEISTDIYGKRIVIATCNRKKPVYEREIFITPKIKWIYFIHPYKVVECSGGNKYKLRELL